MPHSLSKWLSVRNSLEINPAGHAGRVFIFFIVNLRSHPRAQPCETNHFDKSLQMNTQIVSDQILETRHIPARPRLRCGRITPGSVYPPQSSQLVTTPRPCRITV